MTLQVFKDLEQGSQKWFDARCGIVTASVVGQLVTPKTIKPATNDYSRALTATLVAERITGHVEETYQSHDMLRGKMAEPYARDLYAKHVEPVDEVGFMVRREEAWALGYSPDGLIGYYGLIEIKSPRQKTHLSTILADEVPLGYMAQCQAGLLVSGRDWLDYVSYCGGMPLYVKRVLPDERWRDAIIEAVTQFEKAADAMIATYKTATANMPPTERIELFPDLELKL